MNGCASISRDHTCGFTEVELGAIRLRAELRKRAADFPNEKPGQLYHTVSANYSDAVKKIVGIRRAYNLIYNVRKTM